MTTEGEPARPRTEGLTLLDLMVAIAVLAVAFAFLYPEMAAVSSIAVFGILIVKGLRLPMITEGPGVRRWLPWLAWCLSLVACPVAMLVLAGLFPAPASPTFVRGRPWAAKAVDALEYAHLSISVLAAIAIVVMTRGYYRWLAWGLILGILAFTSLAAIGATMATIGHYL